MRLQIHVTHGGKVVVSPPIEGMDLDKEDSNGRTPLHQATMEGDVPLVKALIAASGRVGLPFGRGDMCERSLHIAAHYGNVGVMRVFLEHGVDVNNATAWGSTALHEAAMEEQSRAVEFLLVEAGADVSLKDSRGRTPLQCAINAGGVEVVRLFLQHGGAKLKEDSNGGLPPLHLAAKEGSASAVETICNAGADVNLRVTKSTPFGIAASPEDWSALDVAVTYGHVDALQALIRHGADVNAVSSKGYTALFWAARNNKVVVIDALVAAAADVHGAHRFSIPLHGAAESNAPMSISALLRHGASLNAENAEGEVPLYVAARNGCIRAIEALAFAGADPDIPNEMWSPLMGAASCGQIGSIKKLVQCGADVNAVSEHGETSLIVASAYCYRPAGVIDALVEAGADVNGKGKAGTPLHRVCADDFHKESVPVLLRHGADANISNSEGNTPLHMAVMRLSRRLLTRIRAPVDVVDLLLRAGADETAVNNEGLTAADLLQVEGGTGPGSFEGIECVGELLRRAPADRAWRRRGILLLCRAYARKAGPQQRRARVKMLRAEGGGVSADDGRVEEDTEQREIGASYFSSAVVRLVGVEEDGIFRKVVCFL